MAALAQTLPWHATALRWLARHLHAAADRVECTARARATAPDERLFDSDTYLADVRNRVFNQYY